MKRARAIDHNPDRLRCVVCGDSAGLARRQETLVGIVCECCFEGADGAPYWANWKISLTPGQRTTLRSMR
jgi:hypothetical protein